VVYNNDYDKLYGYARLSKEEMDTIGGDFAFMRVVKTLTIRKKNRQIQPFGTILVSSKNVRGERLVDDAGHDGKCTLMAAGKC
jgi:hypothetical protein